MSNYTCRLCRSSLFRATMRPSKKCPHPSTTRNYRSNEPQKAEEQFQSPLNSALLSESSQTRMHRPKPDVDIRSLLATPTWSIHSLLPEPDTLLPPEDEITPEKLHHLLRLSALPLPKNQEEEKSMLATLRSQLHFVRDIQSVNTDGIKPLQSIRDETLAGIEEITINMDNLKEAFAKEEIRGRSRRPRRMRKLGNTERVSGVEDWDPLSTAREALERGGGKYFVVRSGKGPQTDLSAKKSENAEVRPQGIFENHPESLTGPSHEDDVSLKQGRRIENAASMNSASTPESSLGSDTALHAPQNSKHEVNLIRYLTHSFDGKGPVVAYSRSTPKADAPTLRFCAQNNQGRTWWLNERERRLDLEDNSITTLPKVASIEFIPPFHIHGQGKWEEAADRVSAGITQSRRRGSDVVVTKAISKVLHNKEVNESSS